MAKKKLLSEAQVRKFMGLAKLDANMSSAFLSENWGMNEEEEEMGDEEVSMDAEVEMPVADLEGGEPEEADEADVDVDMTTDRIQKIADALGILGTELSPLMSAAGVSAEEPEMEMDAEIPPVEMDAEMPPVDMDVEAEEEIELEEDWGRKGKEFKRHGVDGVEKKAGDEDGHYKDYEMDEAKIVAEVTRRVAKRINEAARAQKKADKLLGRSKK